MNFIQFFSPGPMSPFQPNLAKKHFGVKGSELKFVQMNDQGIFQTEINSGILKFHLRLLKVFFSRFTGLILSKLDKKHSWVNGFHVH